MTDDFDVVVVGGGGAGLATAVSAAEHGARVLVLEKQQQLGGSTRRAVGSFTAAGTSMQARVGLADNPEDHEIDERLFAPPEYEARNNEILRRHFFEHSASTLDWLMAMGLIFHGPSPEPPNRVPRMHNVVPNARAYIAVLQRRLQRLGGRIQTGAAVVELVLEDGRVVGVVADLGDKRRSFRAKHGVVLAAGDYAGAPDMIAKYRGERFRNIEGINPTASGDGHRLAEAVGAKLVNMDITLGPELRFIPPRYDIARLMPSGGPALRLMGALLPRVPSRVMQWVIKQMLVTWQHPTDDLFVDGAVLVSKTGRRFCDETQSPEREIAVANQPDRIAYILLDERLADRYGAWPNYISTAPEIAYAYVSDYLRMRPDVAVAGSLEHIAASRRIPLDALVETARARDPQTSNEPDVARRWVLLGPVKAYFTNAEGGVSVDSSLRVLNQKGEPIPGLFAAGQTGLGGMVLWAHGLHIAWAMTSGRLLGRALATGQR